MYWDCMCYRQTVSLQNSYVEILTPTVIYIRRWGPLGGDEVMRALMMGFDFFEEEERPAFSAPGNDTTRRQPSASQGEGPHNCIAGT